MARLKPLPLVYEMPRRPAPIEIRIEEQVNEFDLMRAAHDPVAFAHALKRQMARLLADHIVEKCQVFEEPDLLRLKRDRVVRMEFTLHDRGNYEHWLPQERREGRREGAQETIKGMPYGFEPGQFYE